MLTTNETYKLKSDGGGGVKPNSLTNINNNSQNLSTKFYERNGSDMRRTAMATESNQHLPSSFIVQRVERLYGPGALAQGFYSPRKSRTDLIKCSSQPDDHFAPALVHDQQQQQHLPVLKLLRPEFRAQLNVANRKLPNTSADKSRVEVDEDERLRSDLACGGGGAIASLHQPTLEFNSQIKDGHHFLKIHKENVIKLEKLAAQAEQELNELDNEEGCGILRAAAGKARLLVAQKLKQFEGLCFKNIEQCDKEDFPTTNEDLAGFWDMVMIQVNEIFNLFQQINQLRQNQWKNIEQIMCENNKTKLQNKSECTSTKILVGNKKKKEQPIGVAGSGKGITSAAAKARDEARRKMLEERRKALKQSKLKLNDNGDGGDDNNQTIILI